MSARSKRGSRCSPARAEFGSIRIGISHDPDPGELRDDDSGTAAGSVLAALIISSSVAVVLAQWMLRPIHVIQSGLTRLGRGELDVSLDLPGEEFRDLGSSFEAVSAQLSAVRAKPLPSAGTDLESVMENLEDAVALFSPSGEAIFTNAAMKALLAEHRDHPAMKSLDRPDARRAQGLRSGPADDRVERPAASAKRRNACCMTHAIEDSTGRFIGAMLVARNIGYLSQVHSTLNYSRKLSALEPADGGRRPRGQEPAQRDDHPSRAAEAQARCRSTASRRASMSTSSSTEHPGSASRRCADGVSQVRAA